MEVSHPVREISAASSLALSSRDLINRRLIFRNSKDTEVIKHFTVLLIDNACLDQQVS